MIGKTAQLSGITAQPNSLAELLSSKVKAELFRLLFGLDGKPLHVRELERRSGLAVATVRQELDRLTKLGLVESAYGWQSQILFGASGSSAISRNLWLGSENQRPR